MSTNDNTNVLTAFFWAVMIAAGAFGAFITYKFVTTVGPFLWQLACFLAQTAQRF